MEASRDVDVLNHNMGMVKWGYFMSQQIMRITDNC